MVKQIAGAVRLALLVALSGAAQFAWAQHFPSRPVRVLVPYAPGGAPDVISRALAPSFATLLGQQIVVENKPGAGGMPAIQDFIRAPADGYTLLSADAAHWAVLPLQRPGAFNPQKDLVPLGQYFTLSVFLTVHSSMGVKNVQEFISLVKSKPGAFNYGSSGTGSVHHLFMEAFKAARGLDIVHVPYKGAGQMVPALVGGQIPVGISGLIATQAHVKSGALHLLAASTAARSKLAPEVVGMADIGLPELNFGGDSGFFAPAGTPLAVIDVLARALAKSVQQPEFVNRVESLGAEAQHRTPEEMAEVMKKDLPRYEKTMKSAGLIK